MFPPYPRHDDQTTEAHCHSLVVNACILSITGYLEDAITAQRADGHAVSDEAISHLSPGHYEPINPYGTLNFDVADVTKRPRRSLRRSKSASPVASRVGSSMRGDGLTTCSRAVPWDRTKCIRGRHSAESGREPGPGIS